jgi:hypothetical protein
LAGVLETHLQSIENLRSKIIGELKRRRPGLYRIYKEFTENRNDGLNAGKAARKLVSIVWIQPEDEEVRKERKGKFVIDGERAPEGEHLQLDGVM